VTGDTDEDRDEVGGDDDNVGDDRMKKITRDHLIYFNS
jgi:hypothetical protein